LAATVPDRPKALAPIGGRPFLDILFDQLLNMGFGAVVLLLGARHQAILEFLVDRAKHRCADLRVETSIEPSPLGTAGAVKLAARHAHGPFFLLNGDTYLDFDAPALVHCHEEKQALVTLAASHQEDTSRFGRLEVSPNGFIQAFREKAACRGPGFINGGVYLMNPALLDLIPDGRPVSLEQEIFPRLLAEGRPLAALPQGGDFFDIGTPESYKAFASFLGQTSHSKAATT
jgi:NDP-sugar pyrophosphorylase family protein